MTGDEGARRLIAVLSEHGLTAATCESLTAGLVAATITTCLLYTSPSPRDLSTSRMPSSA